MRGLKIGLFVVVGLIGLSLVGAGHANRDAFAYPESTDSYRWTA